MRACAAAWLVLAVALQARPAEALRDEPVPATPVPGPANGISFNATAAASAAAAETVETAAGLPTDVLQFLSLLAVQGITLGAWVLAFALLRPRWRALFAPHQVKPGRKTRR
ncbi:hypothetical protein T492DRAFT_836510 [Pavlovales sp. CCMP2436]|nr:hypothetical protein T492DRAFT_836510 [Pavlovales sp. CCMP2436]